MLNCWGKRVFLKGEEMKKLLILCLSVLTLMATALPAQGFEAGVRGYYWFPSLDGNIKYSDNSIQGTKLDLKDDLGFDDEYYPFGGIFLGLGDHHLSFSFYRADYDGRETLTQDINFGGEIFPAGHRIKSSLDYDVYDFTYQYDVLNLENVLAGFSLGLVGRVEVFDLEAEIRDETSGQSQKEDYTAPVPMLGLNFHLGILADILEARILATGMGYWDGYMVDAQAELLFTPIPYVDISAGYRTFWVDVDTNDLELNYNTSGVYAGITVGF
jgi:outer membrane protein